MGDAQVHGQGGGLQPQPFVVIPFLPPTGNHIYGTNRNGTRYLTKEGAAFKTKAVALIQNQKLAEIGRIERERTDRTIFVVQHVFFFDPADVLNMTFGALDRNGKPKKGAAENRYKKMDVENRIKVVADAFSKAIGIDDSLFFHSSASKCSAALVGGTPQVHIFFEMAEPERFGF
jgi:Holliday junction resolvase RusA-like endonuclease